MYFGKPFLPNMPCCWDFGRNGGRRLGLGLLRRWGWIPLEFGFGAKRGPYPRRHLLRGFPEPLGRPRLGMLLLGFGERAKLQAGLHWHLCLGAYQRVFLLIVVFVRGWWRRWFCHARFLCLDLTTFSISLCIWHVEVPNSVSGSILTLQKKTDEKQNKNGLSNNITLFRSITMLCETDNIMRNILHIQSECEEYFANYSSTLFCSDAGSLDHAAWFLDRIHGVWIRKIFRFGSWTKAVFRNRTIWKLRRRTMLQ